MQGSRARRSTVVQVTAAVLVCLALSLLGARLASVNEICVVCGGGREIREVRLGSLPVHRLKSEPRPGLFEWIPEPPDSHAEHRFGFLSEVVRRLRVAELGCGPSPELQPLLGMTLAARNAGSDPRFLELAERFVRVPLADDEARFALAEEGMRLSDQIRWPSPEGQRPEDER